MEEVVAMEEVVEEAVREDAGERKEMLWTNSFRNIKIEMII